MAVRVNGLCFYTLPWTVPVEEVPLAATHASGVVGGRTCRHLLGTHGILRGLPRGPGGSCVAIGFGG